MLRVGVLLDPQASSAWIGEVVQRLQVSDFARVEIALLASAPRGKAPTADQQKSSRSSFLFRLYERWDRRRYNAGQDALAPVNVRAMLRDVATRDAGDPEILAHLHAAALDVLLSFAPSELHLQGCCRSGVWSIRVGGSDSYLPGPAGFWPMYNNNPVTEVALVIQDAADTGGSSAYLSLAATEHSSLQRNRTPVYWKAADIMVRSLRELAQRGDAFLRSLETCQTPADDRCHFPNKGQMLAFGTRFAARWAQTRAASLRQGPPYKWRMGLRGRSSDRGFDDPSGYRLIPCPADRFYADPFLVERAGKTFLFFEDFRYAEGRAHISCCEVQPDLSTSEPVDVLRRPFHLSYPFLFEEEGELYMVPESKGSRSIELYRAVDFPTGWVSEGPLLHDIYAVDSTIQKIDGKYWMFASVSDNRFSNCDELSLFFADSLRGPWSAHPGNPLISDVRYARPAGALFYHEGKLIRPSQDCSKAYGYGLVFSEVVTLSETEYVERPVGYLFPESIPGSRGNHTYNRTGRFEVIDRFLPARN